MPASRAREWWLRSLVTVVVLGGLGTFLLNMPGQRYDWRAIWGESGNRSLMLEGLWITLEVSFWAMVLALVLGLVGGLMRMSRRVVINQLGTIYVELVRGTPLLVQIMIVYYGFAVAMGRTFEAMGAPESVLALVQSRKVMGVLALGVFGGAYVAEIFRAAVESVDKGQREAAIAQGMTHGQAMRFVLFPQALRRMVPPLAGQFVSLVKDSSLLSVISVGELIFQSNQIRTSTLSTFEVLLPLAVLYLLITFPLSVMARRLEVRLT